MLRTDGLLEYTRPERAASIMGVRFFGPNDATAHIGIHWTQEQREALVDVPYSESILRSCNESHVLTAGFPLSIDSLRTLVREDLWYNGTERDVDVVRACTQVMACRWLLLRTELLTGSVNRSFVEQMSKLDEVEEVPWACEVAWTLICHYLKTGVRLLECEFARCADQASVADSVFVGHFDTDGLRVGAVRREGRFGNLGIAAKRR
jgi:hypothetical protein